ncbi:MAG: MgtC/SapB family protein [Deinococcota bacterium]|jgi:putative Mg2+ transporter-C (MgtC) family protein|nr:MgtC/SapB family protein [Deinococcota bacterium]
MQFQVISEVALAMLLGGLVGLERELADKPSGLRTHMIVAGAAALLVGLGDALLGRFNASVDVGIRTDPIRIVEAIIAGVSFLGAGTIFRRGKSEQVEGITTAASLLLVSAIGISVALRQHVLAVGVTVLALTVLRGVNLIERWLDGRKSS